MSKALKTSVKLDTKSAVSSLDRLEKKIRRIETVVNKTSNTGNKFSTALKKATADVTRLDSQNKKAANSANKIAQGYQKSSRAASILTKNLRTLISTYVGIQGAGMVINASDVITSAKNKLNYLNGGDAAATQLTMDKTYAAAQRSRGSYSDMISNVSKSMTLAGDSFQGNVDNAIRFQEIMSKAYTIGGASAAEQSSSMYQMIQALGSGILQGDELRSVREGAPLAYKAIEEFAQGVLNTDESLKELASQGKITSDMVVAAVMDMGDAVDKAFEDTSMTFAQAWNSVKNMALQAFRPVLEMLNRALTAFADSGGFDRIGRVFVVIANVILWVGNLITTYLVPVFGVLYNFVMTIYNYIVSNWPWISKIILTIAAVIAIALIPKFIAWVQWLFFVATYYLYLAGVAIASAIKIALAWIAANWPLLLLLLILAAVVVAVIWVADSFADACGIIVGVVMAAVAFIWNIIVGVINAIIQFLWTSFVEPWIGIIEWVLNVFNGGFNSFGDAVKNLLGNIISWFLSLGQVVTKIIDAIFGTDWTSGLESLKGDILEWGKNEEAITLSREAPDLASMTGGKVDRWAYEDAYNTGYEWGNAGGQWITDKVTGLVDGLNFDKIVSNPEGSYLPDPNLGLDVTNGTLDDINGNVGDIKDEMDLSNDDLDYLRKIAEMDWRNEFTTAEIKVDMTNNNTVTADRDLDGIVAYLSDVLREEMTSVAYGVHY